MLTANDLETLDRFQFDVPPVGARFLQKPPNGINRLDVKMAFCEMLRRAQDGYVFYAGAEDHACPAGSYVLGQAEASEPFLSGRFGAGLEIFERPRAASRLYLYIPRIARGVVNYLALSPLDRLSFEPDVLVVLANTSQSEILLRAMSYRTGQMWSSKFSSVMGCAWVFVHPYLTGELNYVATGLGHGMRRRKLFPEGHQLISIPFDMLHSLLRTLEEMPWVPPAYEPDGAEFVRRLMGDLGLGPPVD